jgi:hypothetical protein
MEPNDWHSELLSTEVSLGSSVWDFEQSFFDCCCADNQTHGAIDNDPAE